MITQLSPSQLALPEVSQMGRDFFSESGICGSFESEQFICNWAQLIAHNTGHIIAAWNNGKAVAMLGFIISPDINDGKMVAYEAFWFSDKEHRGRGLALIREYEKLAKELGASRISMVHLESLNPERLGKLYQKLGFKRYEVHYFKELN